MKAKMKSLTPTQSTYAMLQHAYSVFNDVLFEGKLPECLITLQRHPNTMGYFAEKRFYNAQKLYKTGKEEVVAEIAINPDYFSLYEPVEIMKTLVHEMTHLFQFAYGKPSRKGYHNIEWANKMESIGLMPSSTGAIGGKKTGQQMGEYIIPNGLFIQAYREHFPEKHNLEWYDNWVQIREERLKAAEQAQQAIITAVEQVVGTEAITIELLTDKETAVEPDSENSEEIEQEQPPTPSEPILIPVKESAHRKKELKALAEASGNRLKYTCPKCKNNIWGKIDLSVRCNPCQQTFQYNLPPIKQIEKSKN